MDCPFCRRHVAESVYRSSGADPRVALRRVVHARGVAYDECPRCGGMFIDKAGLKTLDEANRAARSAGEAAMLAFARSGHAAVSPGDAPDTRQCPRCREEMFERTWSTITAVKVDICPECEGVWLDPGELDVFERDTR